MRPGVSLAARLAARAGLVACFGLVACAAGRKLDRADLARVDTVAVMVRLAGEPTVALTADSVAGQDPARLALALGKALRSAVTLDELRMSVEERFTALLGRTSAFAVVDPVAVGTAMGSFLVDEDPALRDYSPLQDQLGVDAVLEVTLGDYGINDLGPPDHRPGWFLALRGRLVRLPLAPGEERVVIWEHDAGHDGSARGDHPADLQALLADPTPVFRDRFGALLDEALRALYGDMNLSDDPSRG